MFDIIARNLVAGTPVTSEVYKPEHSGHGNSRAIKIRNVETGKITYHPSVYDALSTYPRSYPKILTALIREPSRVWKNLQVKDASDDTPWAEPVAYQVPPDKTGGKFVVICMEHKTTGAVWLGTREQAAKILGIKHYTVSAMARGISTGRARYEWTVRYATETDIRKSPMFKYDARKMTLRDPKN